MKEEYNNYLQDIIDNVQYYSDDELQRTYENEVHQSYFIAWYNDTNNAEGEDKYEIYQAVNLEDAISRARADIGDALSDVEPY